MGLEETLLQCLIRLVSVVTEADHRGDIPRIHEEYFVERLEKDDVSATTLSASFEKQEVPNSFVVYRLVEDTIKGEASFQEAIAELERLRKDLQPATILWQLTRVFDLIAMMVLDSSQDLTSEESLRHVSKKVFHDLTSEKSVWTLKAVLTGLTITNSVKVGDLLSFSIIDTKETLRKIPIYSLMTPPEYLPPSLRKGGVIMEISGESQLTLDLQERVQELLQLLRLFRVGSVSSSHVMLIPDSYLGFSSSQYNSQTIPLAVSYAFNEEDAKPFERFVRDFERILKLVRKGSNPALGPLVIGISRYNSALLESKSYETRIVDVISALEAILLDDNQELRYKLSMRTAGLLQSFTEDPTEVLKSVSLAYEIRSLYLHGHKAKASTAELKAVADGILEWCRKVLLISLKMMPPIGHDAFVKRVDDALVDPKKMTTLREEITNSDIHTLVSKTPRG